MQSTEQGDVALSVTLDTSGLEKETKKIKDDIEKGLRNKAVTPNVDVQVNTKEVVNATEDLNNFSRAAELASSNAEALSSSAESMRNIEDAALQASAGLESVKDNTRFSDIDNDIRNTTDQVNNLSDSVANIPDTSRLANNMEEASSSAGDLAVNARDAQAVVSQLANVGSEMNNLASSMAEVETTSHVMADVSASTDQAAAEANNLAGVMQDVSDSSKQASVEANNLSTALKAMGDLTVALGALENLTGLPESLDAVAQELRKIASINPLEGTKENLHDVEDTTEKLGQLAEEADNTVESLDKVKELFLSNSGGNLQAINDFIQAYDHLSEEGKKAFDQWKESLQQTANAAENAAKSIQQSSQLTYENPLEKTPMPAAFQEQVQEVQEQVSETQEEAIRGFEEEYARFIEYIQAAEEKAAEMAETLEGMRDVGADPDDIAQMESQYDTLIEKIALMKQSIQIGSTAWNEMKVNEKLSIFVYKLKEEFKELGSTIITTVVTGFKKFASTLGDIVKKLGKFTVGKLVAGFKKLNPQINKANNGLSQGIKQILKYALGIGSLMILFNKLRAAMEEGVKNLAQWRDGNNEVNENLSALISSLLQLKNQLAAAFAPIINIVIPILNNFIDALIDAMNYLSQFIATLAGQDTWIKALKVQKNYADSLNKTGKAAKDASGKLARFDDLDVLNQKNNSGAGSIDPNDMFEEMPLDQVEENITDWIEKLKKAWETSDFSDFGAAVGAWIRDALASVPWGNIQEMARKIAHSVATLLNGFFETERLGSEIGKTLAQAFRTAFTFVNEFVHTLHWDSIGTFIGEALVGFVTEFPWEEAGESLGGALVGVITMAYNIVKTFTNQGGWEEIVNGITNFVQKFLDEMNAVDEEGLTGWDKLGQTIYMTVHGILTSLIDLINNLPIDDIMNGLSEVGENANVSQLVKDFTALAESFIKAITAALKKVPWDKVGAAIGEMLNGIADLGDELLDLAETIVLAIAEALKGLVEKINEEHPLAVSIALLVGAGMLAVKSGMIPGSAVANIATVISGALGGIGAVGFKLGAVTLLGIGTAKLGFNFGKWLGEVLGGEDKQWYVDFKWKDFINPDGFKATLKDIVVGFTDMTNDMFSWIDRLAYKVFDFFDKFLDTLANVIWDVGNAIGDATDSIIMGFIEGLYGAGKFLKEKWNAFWADTIFWFKELFGIHSPSTVMAGFGEDIIQGLLNGIESLKDKIYELWQKIKEGVVQKVWDMRDGVIGWVQNIKRGVESQFTAIKEKSISIWNSIKDGLKTPLNAILSGVETMVNGFIKGINKMIESVNNLGSIKVPDWAKSKLGIGDFSINIPTIKEISLPRLAQGAVIPPNREFMAVLGDQPSGTNIEAPLETIKEALAEVMGNQTQSVGSAVMQLDGQTFARLVTPYVVSELGRRGYDVKVIGA